MATLTLPLTDDVTIRGGSFASVNFGTSPELVTKTAADSSNVRRILLKFDASALPAPPVARAVLRLRRRQFGAATERPLSVFWVLQSFLQASATWRDYRTGQAWATPGGDYRELVAQTRVAAGDPEAVFDLTEVVRRVQAGGYGTRYLRLIVVDTGVPDNESLRIFESSRGTAPPTLTVETDAPAPEPPETAGVLTVCQWNIHKAKGSDGRTDKARTAQALAALGADVYSLNEVYYYWGTHPDVDLGEYLRVELERRVGGRWYRHAVNALTPGARSGYGNTILTRLLVVETGTHALPEKRGVARVVVAPGGRPVQVFSTHVEYFNADWRARQIAEALRYTAQYPEPHLLLGDFNTRPGERDYQTLVQRYTDAWVTAKQQGTAASYRDTAGATSGSSRFDYVYNRGAGLRLRSCRVPDTRIGGILPSDHDPVIATFEL